MDSWQSGVFSGGFFRDGMIFDTLPIFMEVSAAQLIQAYYDAAQEDPSILQSLIAARTVALTGMLSKSGGNTLTQSQKNGISYSVLVSLPETTRLVVINQAIAWIKAGIRPTSRTRAGFQNTAQPL